MPKLAPRIVPVIGISAPKKGKPKDAAVPLRKALTKLLRRVGMLGKDVPGDDRLCKLATDYDEYRFVMPTDDGPVEPYVGEPNPELDDNIPF